MGDEQQDWAAALDQMAAGMRDVGHGAAAFYRSLTEGGVPPRYAAIAVGQYLAALVLGNGPAEDDA